MLSRRTPFAALRFIPLLLLGLFYGLTVSTPGIYHASFLESRGFDTITVGHLFMLGFAMGIVILLSLPTLLARIGAQATLVRLALAQVVSAFLLAFPPSSVFAAAGFTLFLAVDIGVYALLDFFIEAKVDGAEGITGRVRGMYLVTVNFAATIGPLIAGFIISRFSFVDMYVFSAGMSFVFLLLIGHMTRGFHDAHYPRITLGYLVRNLFEDRAFTTILSINFLLQLRYAVVVVYLALYLNQVLGFSYEIIGLMVTVANIPFVLFEFPLGALSDTWFGEKRVIVMGFIITCAGALMLAFMPTHSTLFMTAILLIMFSGALMIEIMSESYFFKHVKSKHDAHIVAFRMLIPLSYIVAPLFGGWVLSIFPIEYVFAAVAVICFLGVPLALTLHDTH